MVATVTEPNPARINARPGMSLSDYLARGDERFEIIDGEEVPMSPTGNRHDKLKNDLTFALRTFAEQHLLGSVMMESTFIDPQSIVANWVSGSIVPDIAFITKARMDAYNASPLDDPDLPLPIIPDLVIEIVSPTDRTAKVLRKVACLLDLGVTTIWLINPAKQKVTIYSGDDEEVLTGDAVLATALIPGWSVAVSALFSRPPIN